ncbi:hypothetical protein ABVT39_003702 [Epinephelus coioides]
MEPARKRRISPVWEHFDLITPNKVKCLLCSKELGYSNNTSSMLRHYRALHENKDNGCGPSSEEYGIIAGCLRVLAPFNDATVELSEEKRVSGSKVIPLLSMLDHSLEEEVGNAQTPHSTSIANHLRRQLRERLYQLQSMSIMSLSTLLDPRFKSIGFFSPSKAAEAVNRLTTECAAVIRNSRQQTVASS